MADADSGGSDQARLADLLEGFIARTDARLDRSEARLDAVERALAAAGT